MKENVFGFSDFNVIEDDNYYYIFRSLNSGDLFDIENMNITESDTFSHLRTYCERYEEKKKEPSKYSDASSISLKEIWEHIKMNMYPGTKCISFSTNANVTLDYGYGREKYAMIRVPKNEQNNIYFAGQYMLEELNKLINKEILSIDDKNILEILKTIESSNDIKEILKVTMSYARTSTDEKDFLGGRFYPKQFFSETQQLEYNRILAKLTVLEISGRLKRIMSNSTSNRSLISTIGMAFSSSEVIHYDSKFDYPIESVDRITIELFSLVQQASYAGIDKESLQKVTNAIIDYSKNHINKENNTFGDIDISNLETLYIDIPFTKLDETAVYSLTNGQVDFNKYSDVVEYAYKFAQAKKKSYELCKLLKEIVKDDSLNPTIDEIANSTYSITDALVNRRNFEGKRICETVNLSCNVDNKVLDTEEDTKFIDYLTTLSMDEINELIETNGKSINQQLMLNVLKLGNEMDSHEFFSHLIIDNIPVKKIFGSYTNRTLDEIDYNFLMEELANVDIERVYKSLRKINYNREEISSFVINMLISRKYKGLTLEDISKSKDIDNHIKLLSTILDKTIDATRFDILLGMADNDNKLDNTELTLRDYQSHAVSRIDEIYKTKNYAGVILPTGAGKSFVAIAEMLKHKDEKILYYAPRYEILFQLQKHICKYILGKKVISDIDYSLKEKNNEDVSQFIKYSDVEAAVKSVFPYFEPLCYQGLKSQEELEEYEDERIFKTKNVGLLILDEAHKTGAKKWGERLQQLISNNPNAKMLAITATPIRDVDHEDMILNLAKISGSYTAEELTKKKYIAAEMYLQDAMQDSIVVTPNVVSFDYYLDETEEYKEIEGLYESSNAENREKIEEEYQKIRSLISKSKTEGMSKIIKNAFEKNGKRSNGRYIVFIPHNSSGLPAEEYFAEEIEKIKKYFNEIDSEPEIEYLYSGRKDQSINREAISRFERDGDHLKLLLAVDMLNEGVHIDNVDGVVMLRKLSQDTKILYLQQIGRCIYSLDPNNSELDDSEKPVIFDVYNNYLEQNIDREMNKKSITSDYERMLIITSWINKHKRYPDSNSKNLSEARKALSLRKIQLKYAKYIGEEDYGSKLTDTEKFEVGQIMELCDYIDLWNIEIPERIIPPGETELEKVNAFKVTGTQKSFVELCKQIKKETKQQVKMTPARRVSRILNILDILNEYGVDLGAKTIKSNTLYKDILDTLPFEIKRLVRFEIDEELDFNIGEEFFFALEQYLLKNKVYESYNVLDLRKYGFFEKYTIGNEYYNFIDNKGFIELGPDRHKHLNIYTGTYFDVNGYNIYGKDKFNFNKDSDNLNEYHFDRDGFFYEFVDGEYINTGRKVDNHGFDVEGNFHYIDEEGNETILGPLDNHHFDRDGYYQAYDEKTKSYYRTRKKTDPNGFDIDGIYIAPVKSSDKKTHAHFIEMDGDMYTLSELGIKDYRFQTSTTIYTNLKYNSKGFDQDGFYWEYDSNGIRHKTPSRVNKNNLGADGFFYETLEDGTLVKTNRRVSDTGFDIDGNYYELENGKYVKKAGRVDKDGFNAQGLKIIYRMNINMRRVRYSAFDREGNAYELINHTFIKVEPVTKFDKYGFNIDGLSMDPKTGNLRKYNKYGFTPDGTNLFPYSPKEIYLDKFGFSFEGKYSVPGIYEFIGKPYSPNGFDQDGYYWEPVETKEIIHTLDEYPLYQIYGSIASRKKTKRKYNPQMLTASSFRVKKTKNEDGTVTLTMLKNVRVDRNGFDVDGRYRELSGDKYALVKSLPNYYVNRRNFSFDGYHWEFRRNLLIKTDCRYDEAGFDLDGYYIRGLSEDELKHKKKYNEYFFGYDGYYWKIDPETGEREETKSKLDERGFNMNGMYEKKDSRNVCIDKYGFDRDGNYHKKMYVGEYGYDLRRMELQQQNDKSGEVYEITQYDERGFDYQGINKYTNKPYDLFGFDRDEFYWALDEKTNERVKTTSKVNEDNANYNHEIIDPISKKKTDKKITSRFDVLGNSHHLSFSTATISTPYDERGFDKDGYYYEPTDVSYTKDELLKMSDDEKAVSWMSTRSMVYGKYFVKKIKTNRKYDDNHFDAQGNYWKLNKITNEYENTNQPYNDEGYNFHGFNKDGIHKDTNTEYDIYGFDKNGINIYTGTREDVFGYSIDRITGNGSIFKKQYTFDDLNISSGSKTNVIVNINGESMYENELAYEVLNAIKNNSFNDYLKDKGFPVLTSSNPLPKDKNPIFKAVLKYCIISPEYKKEFDEVLLKTLEEAKKRRQEQYQAKKDTSLTPEQLKELNERTRNVQGIDKYFR